jgi:hypothetical protein
MTLMMLKLRPLMRKKINAIKNIIVQDTGMYEIEQFFYKYVAGKDVLLLFLKILKFKGDVELDFKQTKRRYRFKVAVFCAADAG